MAPPDTWTEKMVPLHEFLELDGDGREGRFPYIWTVDRKNQLSRLLVDEAMVSSCEDRRNFWIMLRSLAGVEKQATPTEDIESRVRQEVVSRIAQGLMQFASGDGAQAPDLGDALAGAARTAAAPKQNAEPAAAGDYVAPWVDTEECTACDECTKLNPAIFQYNDSKKAIITNPDGGPYSDLVKAAEKCTAQVIHPGLPRDRSEKGIDKWIARGEKFN
jgi:pyruvate-ferredoxin/flavodoxin oxidoreductase